MIARRARDRRFLAFVQITTVPAAPDDLRFPLEDRAGLYVCQQAEVALFVLLFRHSDGLEYFRDVRAERNRWSDELVDEVVTADALFD